MNSDESTDCVIFFEVTSLIMCMLNGIVYIIQNWNGQLSKVVNAGTKNLQNACEHYSNEICPEINKHLWCVRGGALYPFSQ